MSLNETGQDLLDATRQEPTPPKPETPPIDGGPNARDRANLKQLEKQGGVLDLGDGNDVFRFEDRRDQDDISGTVDMGAGTKDTIRFSHDEASYAIVTETMDETGAVVETLTLVSDFLAGGGDLSASEAITIRYIGSQTEDGSFSVENGATVTFSGAERFKFETGKLIATVEGSSVGRAGGELGSDDIEATTDADGVVTVDNADRRNAANATQLDGLGSAFTTLDLGGDNDTFNFGRALGDTTAAATGYTVDGGDGNDKFFLRGSIEDYAFEVFVDAEGRDTVVITERNGAADGAADGAQITAVNFETFVFRNKVETAPGVVENFKDDKLSFADLQAFAAEEAAVEAQAAADQAAAEAAAALFYGKPVEDLTDAEIAAYIRDENSILDADGDLTADLDFGGGDTPPPPPPSDRFDDFDAADPLAGWSIYGGAGNGTQTGVEVLSSFSGVLPDGVTLPELPDGQTFFTEDNAGNGDFLAIWSGGGDIPGLASFVGATEEQLLEGTPLVFDVITIPPEGPTVNYGRLSERQYNEEFPDGLPDFTFVNPNEETGNYEDRQEPLIEGSAAMRIFEDVMEGDVLEFDFFFYTEDPNVGDTAYVGLSGVGQSVIFGAAVDTQDADLDIVPVGHLGEYGTIGWVRDFQITISEEMLGGSTDLEVRFAVVNVADENAPTGLFIDNIGIVDDFLF